MENSMCPFPMNAIYRRCRRRFLRFLSRVLDNFLFNLFWLHRGLLKGNFRIFWSALFLSLMGYITLYWTFIKKKKVPDIWSSSIFLFCRSLRLPQSTLISARATFVSSIVVSSFRYQLRWTSFVCPICDVSQVNSPSVISSNCIIVATCCLVLVGVRSLGFSKSIFFVNCCRVSHPLNLNPLMPQAKR